MARAERKALIEKLENERGGRLLIAYVTSTRQGLDVQMADDVLRWLYEHLEANKERAEKGVDLFIHSNGGSGTVPWRIASLIREYAKDKFDVLVPHRAFSAATLLALGANNIVMHRMGCLGPIDPSVANAFNPPNPQNPGTPLPISVEDVTAYITLVKDEFGITHEDELIHAVTSLTEKIHPLALGNVQRSHNQSRLMAGKLLKMHMKEAEAHRITKIIDTLKSKLFFHGHPINRKEAADDLSLSVTVPTPAIEQLMWALYLEYEREIKLAEPFQPGRELEKAEHPKEDAPLTTADLVKQMQQLAASGVGLGAVNEEQLVRLAAEAARVLQGRERVSTTKVKIDGLLGAFVESTARCDVFKTDMTLQRTVVNTPSGPTDGIKHEITWTRWESEP